MVVSIILPYYPYFIQSIQAYSIAYYYQFSMPRCFWDTSIMAIYFALGYHHQSARIDDTQQTNPVFFLFQNVPFYTHIFRASPPLWKFPLALHHANTCLSKIRILKI